MVESDRYIEILDPTTGDGNEPSEPIVSQEESNRRQQILARLVDSPTDELIPLSHVLLFSQRIVEETLDAYLQHFQMVEPAATIAQIRDAPLEEVKVAVLEYFKTHGISYPSEAANDLGFRLQDVMAVVTELEEEGKIRPKEETKED